MAKSTNTSAWFESDWNNGSPRHRVICNLGRKELLAPHAEALLRLLQGKEKTAHREATAVGAWDWGVMLVARHFWQQLDYKRSSTRWRRSQLRQWYGTLDQLLVQQKKIEKE